MDARKPDEPTEEVLDVIDVEEVPEADLEVEPQARTLADADPPNPDSWLQWGLILGLLALLLVCAILILLAWSGR